jgi:hypothetical protein
VKTSDRDLGLDSDITRRDFIHDAGLVALGLSLPIGVVAAGDPGSAGH